MATFTPDTLDRFIDNYNESNAPERFQKRMMLPHDLFLLIYLFHIVHLLVTMFTLEVIIDLPMIFYITKGIVCYSVRISLN